MKPNLKYASLLCYFLCLSGMCMVLWAQQPGPAGRQPDPRAMTSDPQAKKIIAGSQQTVNALSSLQADFTYVLYDRNTKKNIKNLSGRLRMAKEKYRVELGEDNLFVCDGKNVWDYRKLDKEVHLSSYRPEESNSLTKFLKIYNKDMAVKYDGAEVLNGVAVEHITLFPQGKNTEYFKIELFISKAQNIPIKVIIWNRSGSVVTYSLTNLKPNAAMGAEDFTFNRAKYPGVDFIDMRDEGDIEGLD
jgi:outer membrane lipoprotein-sorting protein